MNCTKRFGLLLATMTIAVLLASGAALAAIIDGNDSPNNIRGTGGADIINGLGGNDTISGLGGADHISGGAGNDHLFASDEFQNPRDGAATINGNGGDDVVVGGGGADNLSGGPGNDRIMEGPGDDSVVDLISGGDGDDFISVASIPAAKDTDVDCGPGVDEVEADPLDVLMANCENVTIVRPTGNETDVGADGAADGAPEPLDRTELDEDAAPPEGVVTPKASGGRSWTCNLAPNYRGTSKCGRLYNLSYPEWVRIGVDYAGGRCRGLQFWGYAGEKYLGYARIGECYDRADWIYGGGKSWVGNRTFQAYGRSVGDRWTYASGFVT